MIFIIPFFSMSVHFFFNEFALLLSLSIQFNLWIIIILDHRFNFDVYTVYKSFFKIACSCLNELRRQISRPKNIFEHETFNELALQNCCGRIIMPNSSPFQVLTHILMAGRALSHCRTYTIEVTWVVYTAITYWASFQRNTHSSGLRKRLFSPFASPFYFTSKS